MYANIQIVFLLWSIPRFLYRKSVLVAWKIALCLVPSASNLSPFPVFTNLGGKCKVFRLPFHSPLTDFCTIFSSQDSSLESIHRIIKALDVWSVSCKVFCMCLITSLQHSIEVQLSKYKGLSMYLTCALNVCQIWALLTCCACAAPNVCKSTSALKGRKRQGSRL